MAEQLFIAKLSQAVSANGTSILNYTLSANRKFTITDIMYKSTGTFDVTSISLASGRNFTDATSSNAISSDFFKQVGNDYHGLDFSRNPITLNGNSTLNFDVKDTSGSANTIQLVISGTLDTPN